MKVGACGALSGHSPCYATRLDSTRSERSGLVVQLRFHPQTLPDPSPKSFLLLLSERAGPLCQSTGERSAPVFGGHGFEVCVGPPLRVLFKKGSPLSRHPSQTFFPSEHPG